MKRFIATVMCFALSLGCLIPMTRDSYAGNEDGIGIKFLTEPEYWDIGVMSEGLIWVEDAAGFKYLGENGTPVIGPLNPKRFFSFSDYINEVGDFHEGLAYVRGEDGDQAFIDKNGNTIFSVKSKVTSVESFSGGISLGYDYDTFEAYAFDRQGKPFKYNFMNRLGFESAGEIEEDIFLSEDGKYLAAWINPYYTDGLIAYGYYDIESYEGLYGYMDKDGNSVIEPQFEYTLPFDNGLAAVYANGKIGIINRDGKFVVSPQFDELYCWGYNYGKLFIEDRAGFFKDEKIGFIDRQGNIISDFIWDDAGYFSNGYCMVMKNDKWGYIDRDGKVVIEPQFDDANFFNEGVALVGIGNSYKFIDTEGRDVSSERWKLESAYIDADNPEYIIYSQNGYYGLAKIAKGEEAAALGAAPAAVPDAKIFYNGEQIELTSQIFTQNGHLMVPFRESLEAVGAEVLWDTDTRTATGKLGLKNVRFCEGSSVYTLNNSMFLMPKGVTAFVNSGCLYIPIRQAAEALGLGVEWNEYQKAVYIYTE